MQTSGLRFTDYFSLGDEFQENPMVKAGSRLVMETFLGTEAGRWMDAKVQMGCHTKETRLIVTQKVQLLSAERSCFMKDKKKISLSPTSFHTSKGPRDSGFS